MNVGPIIGFLSGLACYNDAKLPARKLHVVQHDSTPITKAVSVVLSRKDEQPNEAGRSDYEPHNTFDSGTLSSNRGTCS